MTTQEAFKTEIQQAKRAYQPNDEVLAQLKQVHLVAVMGPSGVGKNSVIAATGIHKVISQTSRSMRPNLNEKQGDPYRFLEESDYDEVVEEVRAGNFVQAIQYPTTLDFYGSHRDAYPESGLAAVDFTASQVKETIAQGFFREVTPIYLVKQSFDAWQQQAQHNLRPEQRKPRLQEAGRSLSGCLNGTYEATLILNDHINLAAEDMHRVVRGEEVPAKRARQALAGAQAMLEGLVETGFH